MAKVLQAGDSHVCQDDEGNRQSLVRDAGRHLPHNQNQRPAVSQKLVLAANSTADLLLTARTSHQPRAPILHH